MNTAMPRIITPCTCPRSKRETRQSGAGWGVRWYGVAQSSPRRVEIDDLTSWSMRNTSCSMSTFQGVYKLCCRLVQTFCESSILKTLHSPVCGGAGGLSERFPRSPGIGDRTLQVRQGNRAARGSRDVCPALGLGSTAHPVERGKL